MSKSLTVGFCRKEFWFIIAFAYFCRVYITPCAICGCSFDGIGKGCYLINSTLTIQASSRACSTLLPRYLYFFPFPSPSLLPFLPLSLFLLSIIPLSVHVAARPWTCMSQQRTYTLCILFLEFHFSTWYITALYFEKFWTLLVTGNSLC